MKNYFYHYACIILFAGFIFSSCTSTNEARKFSHLDYVKKDRVHSQEENNKNTKEDIGYLGQKDSDHHLQAPDHDYAASSKESPKAAPQKHIDFIPNLPLPVVRPKPLSPAAADQESITRTKKETKAEIRQDKKELNDSDYMDDLFEDREKLMWLWIGSIVLATLFYALGVAVTSAFFVPAVLFYIGFVVFFVFWIIVMVQQA